MLLYGGEQNKEVSMTECEVQERLKPGDLVRHFKRETVKTLRNEYIYRILSWATHSETEERYVVYKALYGTEEIYIRPYDMFMSEVDREKHPYIKQRYRFERISGMPGKEVDDISCP